MLVLVMVLAKQKAAACQNHTLVQKNSSPRPSRPAKEVSMAQMVMSQAFQYVLRALRTRLMERVMLKTSRGS